MDINNTYLYNMKKTIFITALAAISMVGCGKKESCPVCKISEQDVFKNVVKDLYVRESTICNDAEREQYMLRFNRDSAWFGPVTDYAGNSYTTSVNRRFRVTCK